MRTPHLFRVRQDPQVFAPLFTAARESGLRVGWLELKEVEPPDRLEPAAAMGALRAVAVGGRRAVAVKPLSGKTVLRDLLREYFLGCVLVLVTGELGVPGLEAADDIWVVQRIAGEPLRFDTAELLRALRKVRPFD